MSERYYITGVQLGILLSEVEDSVKKNLINDIINNQFIGNICTKCGGSIKIRNPTGKCDHLYYPENVGDKK